MLETKIGERICSSEPAIRGGALFQVKQLSSSGRGSRLLSRLPPKIGRQDAKRGRGHSIEPARLPYRARTRGFELGAGLVGKSGYRTIVDIREDQALVTTEGVNVG